MTRQPIGHHGPTHLPWGEDPIGALGVVTASANIVSGIPNVGAGSSSFVSFDTVQTFDASKAAWTADGGNPNDTLSFVAPANGTALLMASCSWPAGLKIDCRIFSPSGYDTLHDGFDSMSGYDAAAIANDGPTLMDFTIMSFNVANAAVAVHVRLTNSDAGASAPEQVWLSCIYFTGVGL